MVRSAYPIMIQRIIPAFPGKDARDLQVKIRGFRIEVVQSKQPVLVSTGVAEKAIALGPSCNPGKQPG